LVSADHNIAEAAQTLLAVSSLNRRNSDLEWRSLPPELLHNICWRIISERNSAEKNAERQKAQQLLASYDEGQTAAAAARKLTHLLAGSYSEERQTVSKAGLELFVAALADATSLDQDQIYRLLDLQSISPFAVIQRAASLDAVQAMENIRLLFGFDQLTPRDINLFESGYASLAVEDARASVLLWRDTARTPAGNSD